MLLFRIVAAIVAGVFLVHAFRALGTGTFQDAEFGAIERASDGGSFWWHFIAALTAGAALLAFAIAPEVVFDFGERVARAVR